MFFQESWLCCRVLCCVVLCCAVMSCVVLCCVVLCCAVLCCVVLCRAVLCCAVLCCAVLCCHVLCCVVLCCAVLCCVVLCRIVLLCCSATNTKPRAQMQVNQHVSYAEPFTSSASSMETSNSACYFSQAHCGDGTTNNMLCNSGFKALTQMIRRLKDSHAL